MLHHEIFQSLSPERMRIENIVLSPADEKQPNVMSKPSNFSIDHILNSAGASIDKCATVEQSKSPNQKCTQNGYVNETRDCYIMDGSVHQYPPILNWLQYSRYKPPRLPRPARNGPVKRTPGRLPRIPFSPHQLNELELAYKHANYLSSEDANRLATRLNLTCVRVKIWFQNRRARERREKKELNASTSS